MADEGKVSPDQVKQEHNYSIVWLPYIKLDLRLWAIIGKALAFHQSKFNHITGCTLALH